ncbi:MAG: DNA recombination/repair protein RecA [Thermoanaerobaculia bacterium]|nr:DNA recombination/repair protein RecA [Thermoanaerobaculia bacterium]
MISPTIVPLSLPESVSTPAPVSASAPASHPQGSLAGINLSSVGLSDVRLSDVRLSDVRLSDVGLKTARELFREEADLPEEEVFPTGLRRLDRLLGGGLPRGHLVELMGRESSGRFSCVLSLLAATTQRGEAVALVDIGSQLDPRTAESFGVDLERLLWVRPRRIEEALSAAEILIAGAFPLIVLELGMPPLPGGRGRQIWWVRLARAARRHRGALLVSSPYPASAGTASILLETQASRVLWRGGQRGRDTSAPRLLGGIDLDLERSKSRSDPRPAHAELSLRTVSERLLRGMGSASSVAVSPAAPAHPSSSVSAATNTSSLSVVPEISLKKGSSKVDSLGVPRRPRPRVVAHSHWGYRRPAILPEDADRALASGDHSPARQRP